MRIASLLTAELVAAELAAREPEQVLHALVARLAGHHPSLDPAGLVHLLRERERQSSTALVDGVAIPHARLAGVGQPLAALGRSRTGIDCSAQDGKPTHLFLLLVGVAEDPGAHLRMLAAASRLLHDERCRLRLMEAADTSSMLAALHAEEERIARGRRAA
jgi:mannitol/fructose-specific phosphotransferase system IIA component (Ntr-type)